MTDIILTPVINNLTVTQQVNAVTLATSGPQGATGAAGLPGLTPIFSRQDVLTPYVGTARFYFDTARTISTIRASVGTAPTGAPVVVTVYRNGTAFSTLTIAAGTNTILNTVNTLTNINDYVTVSIISVGSTVAGSDLTVTLNII